MTTSLLSVPLNVYSGTSKKNIAQVQLNGYKISAERPLPKKGGTFHSFTINSGDLWEPWSKQEVLLLHDGKSNRAKVRVAAFPTDDEGFGLLEFL